MRLILLIGVFLLTFNTFGQRLNKSPYETHMEARAISNLKLTFDSIGKNDRLLIWKPYNRIKLTMKTRVNNNVIQKLDIHDGIKDIFSDLDTYDYWSIGSYDIRCKVYLTKKVRFLTRVVITGVETRTYFYSTGLIIKF